MKSTLEYTYLRDHIQDTSTYEVSSFLFPEDILNLGYESVYDGVTDFKKIQKLPLYLDRTLDVIDFDDSLYSRNPQLQKSIFSENRGEKGDKVIEEMGGVEEFAKSYYHSKNIVQQLVNVLLSRDSLLLTAGKEAIQKSKMKHTGIGSPLVPKRITGTNSQKTCELLDYILNEAGFLPGKIIIYDDRVGNFLDKVPSLVKLLGIEIVVNEVRLSEKSINKIESISQTIFLPAK